MPYWSLSAIRDKFTQTLIRPNSNQLWSGNEVKMTPSIAYPLFSYILESHKLEMVLIVQWHMLAHTVSFALDMSLVYDRQ